MWSRRGRSLLLLLFLLFLLALPRLSSPQAFKETGESQEEITPALREEFREAEEAYREGEKERALILLKGFLKDHPFSPLSDDALLLLGRIYQERGEHEEAISSLSSFLRRYPSSPKLPEAKLALAKSYLATGREGLALGMAHELLPFCKERPELQLPLFLLLGEAYDRAGEPLLAISWYQKALEFASFGERASIKERMIALLDRELDPGVYWEVETTYPNTFLSLYARLKLAEIYLRRGEQKKAELILKGMKEEAEREGFQELYADLWSRVKKGRGEVLLGCILPLSGRFRSLGEKVLRGILLGAGIFGPPSYPHVKLLIRDSGGSGEKGREAYRVLRKEGVEAIIGPLLPQVAVAVLEEAEGDLPLLVLAPQAKVEEKCAFYLALDLRSQIEELLEYACDRLGKTRFVIFYPNTPYGRESQRIFEELVPAYGGEVVAKATYGKDQTDFGDLIKGVFGKASSLGAVADALFIPDDYRRVCLLVPQLRFHEVEGLQLLGLSGWNSPRLTELCGRYAEGAVFTGGFSPDLPLPEVRSFRSSYEEAFGSSPSFLEALGYDAVRMILKVPEDDLCFELLTIRDFQGVTGIEGFLTTGEAVRRPYLFQVSDGKIHPLLPPF